MIRFTANFPRIVIETGAIPFETSELTDWLITITDKNNPHAEIVNEFGHVLFLDFDDAEFPDVGHCITDQDVDALVAFINDAKERDVNVWVNCHAGICRSGAIVEVLALLGWEIAETHLSPQRIPNRLVFNKLRRRFPEIKQSWEK